MAKKYSTDKFNLERKKIRFNTAILLFANGLRHDHYYYGEKDLSKILAKQPVKIKITILADLLKVPVIDFEEFQIHVFGQKHAKGVKLQTPLIDNDKVQIAVFDGIWSSESAPEYIYWLPSPNLISKRFLCSVPDCTFTAQQKSHVTRHELNCSRSFHWDAVRKHTIN